VIILDASILIAHLESRDSHHARATGILLDNCDDEFASSAVTLAEYLSEPFEPAAVITREMHWLNCRSRPSDSPPTPPGNWPSCGSGQDSNCRTAACSTRPGFSRPRRWPRSMLALPLARPHWALG